jgi:hypothetical protein
MKAGLQRLPHGERFHCSVGPGKRRYRVKSTRNLNVWLGDFPQVAP